MSVISEIITEISYIIILCAGVAFLFLVSGTMSTTNDIVVSDERSKLSIQEGTGYTGKNVIDGTSMYYDILATGTEYPIYVNGSAVSMDFIKQAKKGNASELLSSISLDATYERTYSQDSNGNITQIIYNRVD